MRVKKIKFFNLLFIAGVVFVLFFAAQQIKAAATLNKPSVNLTGLVGYWSMNGPDYNGASTTAEVLDRSGNGNNGDAQNGPVSATGKVGQALFFDGSNDQVTMGTVSSLNITGAVTVSGWLKVNPGGLTASDCMACRTAGGYGAATAQYALISGANSTQMKFGVSNGSSLLESITSGTAIQPGIWYHLVGTYDGSATTTLYLNGVQVDSDTSAGFGSLNQPGGATFGISQNQNLGGTIDEVRVYNRALSASEILRLYQSGSAKVNSSKNSRIANGLVGLWTFDGADYNSASTTAEVLDRSGNNNHGDATNGPVTILGKVGQAMKFDGVNDFVDLPSGGFGSLVSNSSHTYALWVKTSSSTLGRMLADHNSAGSNSSLSLQIINSGQWRYRLWDNSTNVSVDGGTVDTNWHHIAGTFNDAANLMTLYVDGAQTATGSLTGTLANGTSKTIGRVGDNSSEYFNGIIDDVRVYNRTLSADEIKQLYNMGNTPDKVNASQNSRITNGLVGLWSFNGPDYNSASTTAEVLDRSTNSNNANAVNGPTPSIGKVGQALSFDGSDDYASSTKTTNTAVVTISAWIKIPATPATQQTIIGFANGFNNGTHDKLLYIDTSRKLRFYVFDGAGKTTSVPSSALPVNTWVHVAGTADGTNAYAYVNGVQVGSVAAGNTYTSYSVPNIFLGAPMNTGTWTYFKGNMDEARVYSRALSASEVNQLYIMGN